jgi:glycosyltransferase involved in cell wall biosynthesis
MFAKLALSPNNRSACALMGNFSPADKKVTARILAVSTDDIHDFRYRTQFTRWSGLWQALEERYEVVGSVSPQLPRWRQQVNRLRYFHPDPGTRFAWANLRPWIFSARTNDAERQIVEYGDRYDIMMQDGFVNAPGRSGAGRPYTVYTDGTYRLLEQFYPQAAPLRGKERDKWLGLERELYQQASCLFPQSEFCRASMIEHYGCDPERAVAIGAGLNLPTHDISRKRYDRRVALFVGYDFKRKGGTFLLDAWPRVHRAVPGSELWIVGPSKCPSVLPPGVTWFGPVSDRARLQAMYADATVFVMPSVWEAWGLVFAEAAAFGLPSIGADHCAMPEIIQHGRTGLLTRPRDSFAIADALERVLGNPKFAESLGKAAYAALPCEMTWRRVVNRAAPHIERISKGKVGP